jgi:hypothetical protein
MFSNAFAAQASSQCQKQLAAQHPYLQLFQVFVRSGMVVVALVAMHDNY